LLPEKYCHGAGQEMGWRGGTENVMAIVGLGKACEMADHSLDHAGSHLTSMQIPLEWAKGTVRFSHWPHDNTGTD
jgi:cysteine sulfinate desulfinase/cysteine desulfurase-like protein